MTWTVLDLLRTSTEFLRERGVEGARLDAEILLAHVLASPRIDLYTRHDRPVDTAEVDAYREAIRRRVAREPVAYILGEKEFLSLTFRVTPAVLVPRPETEHLVEETLAVLEGRESPLVADVGTGSGAIAVALAVTRPDLTVHAVDRSAEALAVAGENAARHEVTDRVLLHEGDLLEPLRDAGPFDAIVSNPPYVSEEEWAGLMPEVRDHEPKGALVPGPDPMSAYRTILARAPELLAADGVVLLELPGTSTDAIRALATEFGDLRVIRDYAGRDRVLVARR